MELADTTVFESVPGWESVLAWQGAHPNANATAAALTSCYHDATVELPVEEVHFSSARKYSAVSFGHGPAAGDWVLGAPEVVLGAGAHPEALAASHDAAGKGLRAVILAHRNMKEQVGSPSSGIAEPDIAASDIAEPDIAASDIAEPDTLATGPLVAEEEFSLAGLAPVALLVFRERVRPDAGATLEYFREQGVELKIISGDNPGQWPPWPAMSVLSSTETDMTLGNCQMTLRRWPMFWSEKASWAGSLRSRKRPLCWPCRAAITWWP
ncbi:hypothetical protein NHF46_07340 [Arthrobacter alpinus]|nr:hypothetical protein [Arthrobacter alpinus]